MARDWPVGRADSSVVRPAPESPAPPPDPATEPLQKLILREAARLRQHASGAMTVVLCVDERTELLVHFTQREGGIDASARCEPADAARLGALWPRLQQSLAPRHIALAPLRSAGGRGPGAAPALGVFHSDERGSRSNTPATRPDWESWA